MSSLGNYIWKAILVALSYFFSARLGLLLAPPELAISLIWIPAGIATAALVRWGFCYWPAVTVAASFVMEYSFHQTWPLAGFIVAGQTLGPLMVAYLLKQLSFSCQFKRKHDIFIFTLATFTGLLIPATVGIVTLIISNQITDEGLMDAWLSWWLGDAMGVLVTSPLLLTSTWKALKELLDKGKEFYVGILVTTSLTLLLFFQPTYTSFKMLPMVAIPFFFTVWAALRLDVLGTSLSVFALAFIASSGTAFNLGPFSLSNSQQGAYLLWSYCATGTIFSLMVTAIEIDRKGITALLLAQGEDLKLSNEKLQQAVAKSDKLAKEALQETAKKSQFLAAVTHELRTPMNGVLGASQLLLNSKLTQEQEEVADILRSSGDALMKLVEDVLDYSKIEAGQLKLKAEIFDLKDLLKKVGRILQPHLQIKGIAFDTDIMWHTPTRLIGDELKLQQILLNLASNAIKCTDYGEVSIHVKSIDQNEEFAWLEFSIRDTGIGIEKEQTDKLFEPFVQLKNTSTQTSGTGLGLVITKQLVELMGGTITAKSQVGEGSTFSFTLQFKIAPAESPPHKQPLSNDTPKFVSDKKVLLVEDNEINQKIGKLQLEHLGYEVDIATSGQEAIDKYTRHNTYDVVLMDCQLQDMDGFETTQKIRAYEQERFKPNIPILAFTANSGPAERDKCREAGMDDLIPKPVNLHELGSSLKRWTERENCGLL